MSTENLNAETRTWSSTEKFLFRVLFVFIVIQALPLDWKYFASLKNLLPGLHYGDIFNIAHYYPTWLGAVPSFGDWALFLGFALIRAFAWSFAERKPRFKYDDLYYWLRVIARYRLAIALLGYGFIKFYPLQAPFPSISNLNTEYGFFTRWKLFGLSLGIVPSYESFLGGVEIVLALFLLYRKTASLAAFIVIVFAGNVFMSNIAYEGGEIVYSLFLIGLAFFVLAYDLQRIINLIILQKPTAPNRFKPAFFSGWKRTGRLVAKLAVVFFFVILYGFKTKSGYVHDKFQYPATPGLAGYAGVYNVNTYVQNKDTLAYSDTDPVRWSDVVFENWNTISIRSNRPVIIDSNNTDRFSRIDQDRSFEYEGSIGRHYYSYVADTLNHTLILHNRNKHYENETLKLNYERRNDSLIVLSGTSYDNQPVYAELQKINKRYLLEEVAKRGRRKSFKL
ncbi:MAG: DoxX family protein [Flavitalea sp.]